MYEPISAHLRAKLPGLMAIYAFGSRVRGEANPESDWDIAVLSQGYMEPVCLWLLRNELSRICGCEVDILDFRATSTVMQHQILCYGVRFWSCDFNAELYEIAVLNEKFWLDDIRRPLIEDIRESGQIYG